MSTPVVEERSVEDRWEAHRETICKLFIEEKKTLKQVRSLMAVQGFHASEWQFETKLRDGWGLSKKLQKTDWPVVEHHLSRRERQKKRSEVLLHGILIPQHKVRKEINRNRANIASLQKDESPRLPQGVSIRTPPASPKLSACVTRKSSLVCSGLIAKRSSYKASSHIRKVSHSLVTEMPAHSSDYLSRCNAPAQDQPPIATQTLDDDVTDLVALRQAPGALGFSQVSQSSMALDDYQHLDTLSEDWLAIYLHNTPWYRFQEMAMKPFVGLNLAWATYPLSAHLSGQNLCPIETKNILDLILSLLSSTTLRPSLNSILSKLSFISDTMVPELPCGNVSQTIQQLLYPTRRCSIAQIGELVFFLISNNILSCSAWNHLGTLNKFVERILQYNGADLFRRLFRMKTPTAQAVSRKIFESIIRNGSLSVDQFLDLGADMTSFTGPRGFKFLQTAIQTRKSDYATLFIESGADVNPRCPSDSWLGCVPPLTAATLTKDVNLLRCLLRNGADLEAINPINGGTALSAAVNGSSSECIGLLLEAGADYEYPMIFPYSLLDWAYVNGIPDIYTMLLSWSHTQGTSLTLGGIISAAKVGTYALSSYLTRVTTLEESQSNWLGRALIAAVKFPRHSAAVRPLLEFGVDPNASVRVGHTRLDPPLVVAAEEGDMDMAVLLLEAGADANNSDAIVAAAHYNDSFEILGLFIKYGVSMRLHGAEALCSALDGCNTPAIRLLLESGVDASDPISRDLSAIQFAVQSEDYHIVELLINAGANVNGPPCNHRGYTALHYAVARLDVSMIRLMLNAGAQFAPPWHPRVKKSLLEVCLDVGHSECNPHATEQYTGCKPLSVFKLLLEAGAHMTHPEIGALSFLIEHRAEDDLIRRFLDIPGVDVNEMGTIIGATSPIQAAAKAGRLDLVKELIARGANLNAPPAPSMGRTALQAACDGELADIGLIKFLLDNGADVNADAAIDRGVTAIQGASIQGHIKVVLVLLEHGADINADPSEERGRMALDGAAENGRLDMVQLLLNAQAKSSRTGETGYDGAIELAEEENHYAVADLLRSHSKSR